MVAWLFEALRHRPCRLCDAGPEPQAQRALLRQYHQDQWRKSRMKRWLITLFAALLALTAAATDKADRVSAMTYNIRLDLDSAGPDAWPHRRKALTGIVAYYAPDFVGMQEVLLHQKRQVEADLPAYKI